MKTHSYDYYGGKIPPQTVVESSVLKKLPSNAKRIVGFEVCASTFGPRVAGDCADIRTEDAMHVDVWCSLGQKCGKESDNVFGTAKTGSGGHAINSLMGLNLPVTSFDLYVNFWVHNMRSTADDWHCGIVIYYEET
jgi:hypothetical protein